MMLLQNSTARSSGDLEDPRTSGPGRVQLGCLLVGWTLAVDMGVALPGHCGSISCRI